MEKPGRPQSFEERLEGENPGQVEGIVVIDAGVSLWDWIN